VLVLRYHQDLPEQEVARLLRITVGTVKSLTSRAMTRLRRDLERQLPDRTDSRRTPP
jgi:DNA-directed RNA polymerase specialized sigma24 family protein